MHYQIKFTKNVEEDERLAIYTDFGDRGGPLFREKIAPEVEGSKSPNRREKTRGRNSIKKRGDCIS